MKNTVRIKRPNAAVFIYNYVDRLGSIDLGSDPHNTDQIILNTLSLKSVSTQKNKSNPAGAFELRLAPIKNWVTEITPGSWCVILMANDNIVNDKAKYGGGTVDQRSFKMLGRIESVRGVISTNQTTGAKETEYIVTGSDWGTIFNSKFYVDVLNRVPNESNVGMAERFGYTEYLLKHVGYDASTLGGKAQSVPSLIKRPDNDKSKSSVNSTLNFFFKGSEGKVKPPLIDAGTTSGEDNKEVKTVLPNARDNVDFILSLWGRSDTATSEVKNETGLIAKSNQVFKLPNQLAKYLGLVDKGSKISPVISQILKQTSGRLTGNDKYSNDDTSAGIIDFNTILGEHSIWQILNSNCNNLMNELIPEIRFENGIPKLTLYNRIRPFTINNEGDITKDDRAVGDGKAAKIKDAAKRKDTVENFMSPYKYVRKININADDVIMSSFGTNWRDRVNFIEVTIARSLFQENYAADIKLDSQFVDQDSIGRDGLLSMMASTTYVPTKNGIADPTGVSSYKYIMKEWYFNTHKMFNGQLTLIGQDQYIQVGDNIMVESKVVNRENYNNNAKQKSIKTKTYLMAHVESVNHNVTVDSNGGRVFTTQITFVRGIIADINGNLIVEDNVAGAVDQDSSKVTPQVSRTKQTTATSSPLDPDRQRLRGE